MKKLENFLKTHKNKGDGTSPEQEQLVHSLLHSGGKFLA